MKKIFTLILLGTLTIVFAACAPGPVRMNRFLFNRNEPMPVTATPPQREVNTTPLDNASQAAANRALKTALLTHQNTSWQTTTASGTITLKHRYKLGIAICQPFISTVIINNQKQVRKITTCTDRHGNWMM